MVNEATASEFSGMLEARGVTRRSFMKLCGTDRGRSRTFRARCSARCFRPSRESVIGATKGNLYPVIWIEGASCTGCTESFAQVETPDPAEVVLELLSLNYSETLSAAAGWSMEEAKEQTIESGNYVLVYEGAVLEGWGGQALRVADKPGTEHLIEAAKNAKTVVALGSCAVNGGWMGAHPNSSDALGVAAVPEEVRHRGSRRERPWLPGEPRVARFRARRRDHARQQAAQAHEREQARGHLRPDHP